MDSSACPQGLGTPASFVASDFSAYSTPVRNPMQLTLPAMATEGDGVLAGQGTVSIASTQASDVVVSLASSNPSEVTVPATVTILAGQLAPRST